MGNGESSQGGGVRGGDVEVEYVCGLPVPRQLVSAEELSECYELLHVVGKGQLHKVISVRRKESGELYSMVVVRKRQLQSREAPPGPALRNCFWRLPETPTLASCRWAFQTESKVYFVFDAFDASRAWCFREQSTWQVDKVRAFAAQLVVAHELVHQQRQVWEEAADSEFQVAPVFVPENVFCNADSDSVTLTSALTLQHSPAHADFAYSLGASEQVRQQEDWWCIGALLVDMLTGQSLFGSEEPFDVDRSELPADAASFVKLLLSSGSDPPSMEQVQSHCFLKSMEV